MRGAVAVDLGASSGRYAAGQIVDGRIEFEVIRQIPHSPFERNGHLVWDIDSLIGLCREAVDYASRTFSEATVGIDSWGVDHGFVDTDGTLVGDVVCYRDLSHLAAFERLAPHRARLYALTGCQHQPFNTICQLLARRSENPDLVDKTWMILPDLLGFLLGAGINHELTQASTTQLLGLDNQWSEEAFVIAGWPVPSVAPSLPGQLGGYVAPNVRLAHVGSHDTASAVLGFGSLRDHQAFLNVGTWSLFGCLLDSPLATTSAEAAGFTNERAVDGRVRFLKNIPGFYVINRVHEELKITASVPDWLAGCVDTGERVDLLDEEFFNPASMVVALTERCKRAPASEKEWAGLALHSLAATVGSQAKAMESLTGRKITELRVGGGGSQSRALCRALESESGLRVVAGPVEATVLGNLALQFLASGEIADRESMMQILDRSIQWANPQEL